MTFLSKNHLIELLTKMGVHLDKKRGQCYLIDRNIVNFIIFSADLDNSRDIILEIGPGIGTLSNIMIEKCKKIYLVELDKKIAHFLYDNYKNKYTTCFLENPNENELSKIPKDIKVVVIHADILKIPFPKANKIVSNIPYQISAPLLFKIIENWSFSTVNLMVQKEFADRLMAKVNSANYSRLTASTNLFLKIKKKKSISRTSFYPLPKVESNLIELELKEPELKENLKFQFRENYLAFLRGIFPYKNKSIRNALIHYMKRDENASRLLNSLKKIVYTQEEFPFLSKKLRSFSPEQLFSIMYFGLTGKSEMMEKELKNVNEL